MPKFKDNLPLGRQVEIHWKDGLTGLKYTYRGYEGANTRRCAVGVKGDPRIIWVDRTIITPAAKG